MARTTLSPGDDVPVGGQNAQVFFTAANEEIDVADGTTGNVTGFQNGGDTISFAGAATNYHFAVAANNVTVTGPGGTSLTFAVGSTPGTIKFANGDSRSISFTGGAVVLGSQTLPNNATTDPVAGPGTYTIAATDTLTTHTEGTQVQYTVSRTTTTSAEDLSFSLAGFNNNGTVTPALPGSDFTIGSATVHFNAGDATATVTVTLNTDAITEGVEGYTISVFKGATQVASVNQLIIDATNANNVGQTFNLTGGTDTVGSGTAADLVGSGGSTDVSRDDTIVAANNTATAFDNVNGGAGKNTLVVFDTENSDANAPNFAGFTLANIQNIQYNAVDGFRNNAIDLSGVTSLQTLTAVISDNTAQAIKLASTGVTTVSVANNGTGDLNFTGGGGVLNAIVAGGNVNVGVGGVQNSFTAVTVTGAEDVNIADIAANGSKNGTVLTTVTLDGITDDVTLEGDALATINARNIPVASSSTQNWVINDAADTLTINFSNVNNDNNNPADLTLVSHGSSTLILNALTAPVGVQGVTTDGANLQINATAGFLSQDGLAYTGATGPFAITMTGAGPITIQGGISEPTAGTTIDGTGNSGGITLQTILGNNTDFDGGSGNDTITLGATKRSITMGGGDDLVNLKVGAINTAQGGSIDAGAGKDTLVMTSGNAAAISAINGNGLSNFDVLRINQTAQVGSGPNIDQINLANIGFAAGVPTYVQSSGAIQPNVAEVTTIAFSGGNATGADKLDFAGISVVFTDDETPAQQAAQFAAAINANSATTGYTATVPNIPGPDINVILTKTTTGATPDLTSGNFVFTDSTSVGTPNMSAPSITQGANAIANSKEVQTVTLTDVSVLTGQSVTITLGSKNVVFNATQDLTQAGGALADALVKAINASASGMTATQVGNNFQITAGEFGNLGSTTLTGTGIQGTDVFSVSTNSDGSTAAAATTEKFDIAISGLPTGNDQFFFNGRTVTLTGAETTNEQIASEIAAAFGGNYLGWTASWSGGTSNVVTFTATSAGAKDESVYAAAANLKFIDDTNIGTPAVSIVGVGTQGTTNEIVLNNFSLTGGTLEITGATGGVHTINQAAGGTSSDSLTLLLSSVGNDGTVNAAGYENIAINTGSSSPGTDQLNLVDANAKTLTITGSDSLNLTETATGITTVDASGLGGFLTWTSAAIAGPLTVKTGSGGSFVSLLAATGNLTFVGGSGGDHLDPGNQSGTIDTGAGNDLIHQGFASGTGILQITTGTGNDTIWIGTPINGNSYSTITDFDTSLITSTTGDQLSLGTPGSITSWATAQQPVLPNTASFQDYLDAANAGGGGGGAHWFQFGGNTYVVQDNSASTTYDNGVDRVVQISGLVNLSGLELQGGYLGNFV